MTEHTLWTIQPRAVLDCLNAGEPYHTRQDRIARHTAEEQRAYRWLMDAMERRGLHRPAAASAPLWAWTARPPVSEIDLPPGHPHVLLELAVPMDERAAMRLEAWEKGPLRGSLFIEEADPVNVTDDQMRWWNEVEGWLDLLDERQCDTEDEAWNHPDLAARITASWEEVFNLQARPDERVQVAFWALRPEHLIRAHRLKELGVLRCGHITTTDGQHFKLLRPSRLLPGRVVDACHATPKGKAASAYAPFTVEHAEYDATGVLQLTLRG